MTNMPTLTTARLIMRPFTLSDADDLFSIRGDREAMKHWDWPQDENLADTKFVAEIILGEMREHKALYWTARLPNGTFAGVFDLSELDDADPHPCIIEKIGIFS